MKKVTQKLIPALFFSSVLMASSFAYADNSAQLDEGRMLFTSGAQPISCAVCHTMDDAGTTGTIGPNLDELQPDAERIRKALNEGMGAMPSFADSLDDCEREAILEYVLHATGQE